MDGDGIRMIRCYVQSVVKMGMLEMGMLEVRENSRRIVHYYYDETGKDGL